MAIAEFFTLALRKEIVVSAIKVSLIVGTILAVINHGPAIINMQMDAGRVLQMLLTYLVPYCVSTFSAVKAVQRYEKKSVSE